MSYKQRLPRRKPLRGGHGYGLRRTIPLILILIVTIITTYLVTQVKQLERPLTKDSKGMFDLEAHWAQGNVVSLVRHTERCDRSDNQCFDGTDGITALGKAEAIKLGKAYGKYQNRTLLFITVH